MNCSGNAIAISRAAVLGAALTLMLAAAGPLRAAQAAGGATTPATAGAAPAADANSLEARLAAFDSNYDVLRNFVDNAGSDTTGLYRDTRGRTIDDDIHDWVLGEDARSHIEALRREAGLAAQQGNRAGAQQDLAQAQQLLDTEVQRVVTIRLYWRMSRMLDAHRDLWQQLLDEVTPVQAAASHARIDPLEQQLLKMLGPDMMRSALEQAMQNLIGVYNQERGDLARSVSEQRIVAGAVDPQVPRRSPCPAASTGNSGSGRPKFVPGSVSLLDYYPPDQQRDEVEGRAILRLRVNERGCMESSSLQISSGSPALDDAAVALVEHARFLPAQAQGRPVAASFDMAVRFELPPEDKAAAVDKPVSTPSPAQPPTAR